MNITYGANDKYVPFLGISLKSLLENNKEEEQIVVHILSDGITAANQLKLRKMVEEYGREILFYDVTDVKRLIPFEIHTAGFHPVILARLFLSKLIGEECKRIIYLDCDTIVAGSLHELETTDLKDFLVGMVPELHMPVDKKALIGIEKRETYYNSGVLLINLELWREEEIDTLFMKYYEEREGKLLYADQDILNYCCKGKILTLPQKFNLSPNIRYFPRYFVKNLQPAYDCDKTIYENYLKHPVVIHYMGDERPWIHGNRNAYRAYFEKYRAISPWHDLEPVRGQEWYMCCYHMLNVITLICPGFRILFSKFIGINKYKWFGKD